MNKRELKVFLTMLLNPLILSIENSGLECMDLSIININNEIIKKKITYKDNLNITLDSLLEKIPKTTIHFKQKYVLESEQEEEENADRAGMKENDIPLPRESVAFSNMNKDNKTNIDKRKESYDVPEQVVILNKEYKIDLTLDKIYEKIINEKRQEIKDFYLYQLEQIGEDRELFTNSGLKLILEDSYFKNNKTQILVKYIDNFIFIKQNIDYLIKLVQFHIQ